jgi:murein L,D-transpeptidase YafK
MIPGGALNVSIFHSSTRQVEKCYLRTLIKLLASCFLSASILAPLPRAFAAPAPDIWLSVDTHKLSIAVMRGDDTLQVFENIAIGSNGPSMTKKMGDETTPLGEFTITQIRPSTRFELFMAFNYPNLDHAERAFRDQRIDASEYQALRHELDQGRPPPQSTSLGGYLGIHGLGAGSPEIHETINWTDGCIALTNEQLVELAEWVVVGTRVVVR